MKGISRFAIGIVALGLLFMIVLSLLTVRIGPGQYGVKVNQLGGGVVEKDYPTGIGVRIPFVHTWHFIDRRTHFITFAENNRGTSMGQVRPALEIRTKDNNLATYEEPRVIGVRDKD